MGRVAAREVEEAAEPEDRAVGKEEVVKEGVSMGVREAAVTAAVKVAEAAAVAREVVVREAGGEGGGGVVPHPDRHGTDGGGRAYGDTALLTYTLRGPISPSVPPKKIRFTPTAPPTTF